MTGHCERLRSSSVVPAALLALVAACAPPAARAPAAGAALEDVRQVEGRPAVAMLAREGDPEAGLAVAVLTEGVDRAHGVQVPVALAGLLEARLQAAGVPDVRATPGAEGLRVTLLAPSPASARALISTLRDAMTAPVDDKSPDLAAALRKLGALERLPVPDAALRGAAECSGDLVAPQPLSAGPPPSAATLEAWRRASFGQKRVVVGIAGSPEVDAAIASAVADGPAWPVAAPVDSGTPSAPPPPLQIYDASADVPAGAARLSLMVRVTDPARAIAAAHALEDRQSLLAERLDAVLHVARLREVAATAHVGWGCLRLTFDLPSPPGNADPRLALALAVVAARRAVVGELPVSHASWRDIANAAGDPRDAADRLAYWTLLAQRSGVAAAGQAREDVPTVSVAVGVGVAPGRRSDEPWAARASALRTEIEQAASTNPGGSAAELRVRVERGQSGVWMLLASPCGTESEAAADAGASALAAMAIADRARREAKPDEATEAWIAADGVGLMIHAAGDRAESPAALAQRSARLLARSFGSALEDPRDLGAGRGAMLSRRGAGDETAAFSVLADAIAPGHPSWLLPTGTWEAIERSSDEGVRARLDAMRSGPLRLAVIADHDPSQGAAALEAMRLWLADRATASATCPGTPPITARPGTYAIDTPGASSATAWLAFALPASDPAARAAATLVAAALQGPAPSTGGATRADPSAAPASGGLLARALGAGLARSWSARVLGPPRAPALVVRVVSAQASLDGAVAEVRVLLDRLRQGGLSDGDLRLALEQEGRDRLASSLDPRSRLIDLWRGDAPGTLPSAEAVRDFAARTFKDEALIIVAARPPRIPAR